MTVACGTGTMMWVHGGDSKFEFGWAPAICMHMHGPYGCTAVVTGIGLWKSCSVAIYQSLELESEMPSINSTIPWNNFVSNGIFTPSQLTHSTCSKLAASLPETSEQGTASNSSAE